MKDSADFDEILQEIKQGLGDAVDEILSLATQISSSKESGEINHEDYTGAEEFFIHANHPKNRQAIESYVFEILKAYGCCSMNVKADEDSSRQTILDIEKAHPNFKWAKNIYMQSVSVDDLEEDLSDEEVKEYTQRLENWIN